MLTNIGARIRTVAAENFENHGNACPCYSCSNEECDGFITSIRKSRHVKYCNSWTGQVFNIPEETFTQILGLIDDNFYRSMDGKHNVTQSSGTRDHERYCLALGFKYLLSNRLALNFISDLGELINKQKGNDDVAFLMAVNRLYRVV